jgi:hypothetical protein
MKKNMGLVDRIIRLIVAAVVVWLYYNGTISGTLGIVLIVVAVVFVLTSLVSVCPLYLPFGLSTRGKTAEEPASKPADSK